MKIAAMATLGLLCLASLPACARGVTPYLPLNLNPAIERQIERVLMLAGKPVLTRPIAAATVLEALPQVCRDEPALCQEVRSYLARYMRNWSVTDASVEVAASRGALETVPNQYGLTTESHWVASAHGLWQPYDHAIVSVGAVAYQGEAVIPEGTLLSLGFDRAQLDIGYRTHWFSPSADSSMLISTEAATMPSITLSNYQPLTRFGLQYEAFVASMSKSEAIAFDGGHVSGRPRLAGVHVAMEPASGWALGANRLLQYGGGPRPGSFSDLVSAFFNPARYDNTGQPGSAREFGNQVASVTSAFVFPGKVPFTVYFEHAGEDTSDLKPYLLGNAALSIGIHFPRLWHTFDLTYEVSEWQNAWYVNANYGDGLTNRGHVIGHWGGDERRFGDAVGAQSHMLRIGWEPGLGGLLELRLSTLANESYSGVGYERAYNGTLRYARPFGPFMAGAEVFAGRDVFGGSFGRAGAFFRYAGDMNMAVSSYGADFTGTPDKTAELSSKSASVPTKPTSCPMKMCSSPGATPAPTSGSVHVARCRTEATWECGSSWTMSTATRS